MVDMNRGTAGVNLPPAVASDIWARTTEESAVMRASRKVQLPGAGQTIPVITGDAQAAWVAETDEKPVSRPTLSNRQMTPYTVAVIVPFSNQFRRDLPALYNELVRRLPYALAETFDATVFGAVPVPGSNFDTLANAPQQTVDDTDTYDHLAAVVNTVAAGGGDLSAWLASPQLHGLLLTARDNNGRAFFVSDPANQSTVGSVFGAPVYKTRARFQPNAIGVAGDFANSSVYGTVEGVQVSYSDQATLTDGDTDINLWQRNMFAVRAEIEIGFLVRDVNHFVRINNGTAIA